MANTPKLLCSRKVSVPTTIKVKFIVKHINIFVSGFSLLLWIGAFLCFTAFIIRQFTSQETDTDNLILGIVLVVVVVVTGGFTFFQEHKSQKVSRQYEICGPFTFISTYTSIPLHCSNK